MKKQKIKLVVNAEITFNGEQDRLDSIAYAKHLILTTNGTGVKFEAVELTAVEPLKTNECPMHEWVFERRSGYAGWRCKKCASWISHFWVKDGHQETMTSLPEYCDNTKIR